MESKLKMQKHRCHLLIWNDSPYGWDLGELDMNAILKLDKEIAIYQSHMENLFDGVAPPSCYKNGLPSALSIYESRHRSGNKINVPYPVELKVIVDHDFADDDLQVTSCSIYEPRRWSKYHRRLRRYLDEFIENPFDPESLVSLGHRLFPTIKRIMVDMPNSI